MNYNNILSETNEGVCYITINRPKQLNALNGETIVELNQAITAADTDSDVRCIILTGAENKAFVAGADIKEFAEFDKSKGENLARKGQELLFDLLDNAATPSIAAINGFALGGLHFRPHFCTKVQNSGADGAASRARISWKLLGSSRAIH